MSTTALVAVLLAAALLATSPRLGRLRAALGLTHLATTGHLFLGLGFVVGLVLTEADRDAIRPGLTPVVALAAGWIGFSVGMGFHGRVLRRAPARAFVTGLAPGLVAALVVGALAWLILGLLAVPPRQAGALALVAAAAAAPTSPTLAAAVRARRPQRSRAAHGLLRMVAFSASLDDAITVLLGLTAFAVFHHTAGELPFVGWWLGTLGLGGLMGAVTWLFLGGGSQEAERLLLGLGMVAFAAGAATWLELDAAVVCAIAGAVLVNLPGDRMATVRRTLGRIERPALVVVMTLAGVWAAGVADALVLIFVALLTVVRRFAKLAGARLVEGRDAPEEGLLAPPGWGHGLAPQGSLGLVVALGAYQVWQDVHTQGLLAAVALAAVVNELVAPRLLLRAVQAAEEGVAGPQREA